MAWDVSYQLTALKICQQLTTSRCPVSRKSNNGLSANTEASALRIENDAADDLSRFEILKRLLRFVERAGMDRRSSVVSVEPRGQILRFPRIL